MLSNKVQLQNNVLFNFKRLSPLNIKRFNKNYIFAFVATHLIYYPTPITLTYAWSFGFLAGMCLLTQMISGIFLAMHYTPHVDLAFSSVEYIMLGYTLPPKWFSKFKNTLKNWGIFIFAAIKNNFLIFSICMTSLFLLAIISPVFSILLLCMFTLYFLYLYNSRDILKIWGFTLSAWYIIFTTSLSEVTILIGFENTELILSYLSNNQILFENLCFQTVYLLDALSAKLGFSIYIPAIINIFSF